MNIKKNLVEMFQYVEALGWGNGLNTFAKIKFNQTSSIRLKEIKYPFQLRAGSSDINAFRQIFIYKEYSFDVKFEPSFIIDGGSNIGLAGIYFANRFPGAQIVCIEPEHKNFQLLEYNTKKYEAIHPLKSGIWMNSTFLKVRDLGFGNWGFVVEEKSEEGPDTFRATSIGDILKKFNKNEVDIVKLDVEGAEKEIFTDSYQEWIPITKILVVELHDRMKPGCSRAFFRAMLNYNFTIEQLGENLICYRE